MPARVGRRPGLAASVGSDAEIRSHGGDDGRRVDEVAGNFLIPHNEIAVFSGVAFGPHSLELADTAAGVRHRLRGNKVPLGFLNPHQRGTPVRRNAFKAAGSQ